MVGNNLSIVIPFYNGHEHINKLIESIPKSIPVLIIDDHSDEFLYNRWGDTRRVTVVRPTFKGYFTGAVNYGIGALDSDVLVLNQDTWFENTEWMRLIDRYRDTHGMVGERIRGRHPSFGDTGYIHGTFMFLRRDVIDAVGLLNDNDYPLWGSTAEYQWRVARKGFKVLPLAEIPGFHHERAEGKKFGSSISRLLEQEKDKMDLLVRTPPLLSVVVPCYNYGRFVSDCVNSLIGGPTSLGIFPGQTLQSFEIIIVDDASRDKSWDKIQAVTDEKKGIRAYRLSQNKGTAGALNYGIDRANGKYITFLSADDMREPGSLEALVRACEDNPHSFAYDDIILFAKDKRVRDWRMGEYDFEEILFKNNIHAGIVYPKRAWEEVGGYPEIMRNGREDWAFNVALGIYGWCGKYVKQFGYLYRREHQNRSLTNTSPEHHERFLRKISGLFPEVYGGYRPEMCCGKKPKRTYSPAAAQQQTMMTMQRSVSNNMNGGSTLMAKSVGTEGMVELVYLGKQQPAVWDGNATYTRYRFGIGRERGWVDVKDAGERGKGNGLLNVKDSKGNWLFEVATQSASETTQRASSKSVVGNEPTVVVGEAVAPVEASKGPEVDIDRLYNPPMEVGDNLVVAVDNEPDSSARLVKSVVESDIPDISDMSVRDIMALDLDKAGWRRVYEQELASDKPRKSLITALEEKLASE